MSNDAKANFGMIGLAVMGRNLALNILDHDYSVAGYNLEPELTEQAVSERHRGCGYRGAGRKPERAEAVRPTAAGQ